MLLIEIILYRVHKIMSDFCIDWRNFHKQHIIAHLYILWLQIIHYQSLSIEYNFAIYSRLNRIHI